jgi:uncharacterized protein (TIGR00730 family)
MRVAVFTGSGTGPAAHVDAVAAFARRLAGAGVGIVYGGGRVGLMGVVADAALSAGGEVIGVMSRHLVDQEIAHRGVTDLHVVEDMHQRKARMAELADAFIALPGGAGTLEELFEAWTWGQLGLHAKPTALLDIGGFYQPLVEQLSAMAAAGYLGDAHLAALGVVADADQFLRFVAGYQHPPRKWLPAAQTEGAGGTAAGLTSVGWLHVRDGRLLAVRSRGRDAFYLPGGKLEAGESHEQALVREVREELGVRLRDLRPAFTVNAPAHGFPEGTHLTMHCYYADPAGEPSPANEIAELAWLDLADPHQAAPAVRRAIAELTGGHGSSG